MRSAAIFPRSTVRRLVWLIFSFINNSNFQFIPQVAREQCASVPRQVCQSVPVENCQPVKRQKCSQVPREDCQPNTVEHCEPITKAGSHLIHQICQTFVNIGRDSFSLMNQITVRSFTARQSRTRPVRLYRKRDVPRNVTMFTGVRSVLKPTFCRRC